MELCYREEVPGEDLAWVFLNFTKFVDWFGKGPPDYLPHVIEVWLSEAEALATRIREIEKHCNSLTIAIGIKQNLALYTLRNPMQGERNS